jgi:hypothetical protein
VRATAVRVPRGPACFLAGRCFLGGVWVCPSGNARYPHTVSFSLRKPEGHRAAVRSCSVRGHRNFFPSQNPPPKIFKKMRPPALGSSSSRNTRISPPPPYCGPVCLVVPTPPATGPPGHRATGPPGHRAAVVSWSSSAPICRRPEGTAHRPPASRGQSIGFQGVPPAARIIAKIPALIASGRAGQASMMPCRSGPMCAVFVSTAPAFAPASAEMPVFPVFSGVCSRTENPSPPAIVRSVAASSPLHDFAPRLDRLVELRQARQAAAKIVPL